MAAASGEESDEDAGGITGDGEGESGAEARRVGPAIAHPARIYDYYLGGKDHFQADRDAAEQAKTVVPDARQVALANRGFLVRAVTAIADAGIDQFIDIGTGFPTSPNVHEVAQGRRPGARVVYVDNDDEVVAHTRALRAAPGVTAIEGDARHPGAILASPELTGTIDFARPVGVLFIAILHFLPGPLAARVIDAFRQRAAAGSMIAVSHITSDGMAPEAIATIKEAYSRATAPAVFRTGGEIEALFGDCWMLTPGVTLVQDWRPPPGTAREQTTLRVLGGVARVPDIVPPTGPENAEGQETGTLAPAWESPPGDGDSWLTGRGAGGSDQG